MFAFCQYTKHENCIPGSPDPNSIDMSLTASEDISEISVENLRFVTGRSEFRQYDSCYYSIGFGELTEEEEDEEIEYGMEITILEAENVNVYMYRSDYAPNEFSRGKATDSIITDPSDNV